MSNPLLDYEFLKELDLHNDKTVYVKIISLDLDENPTEIIEGRATGGSITLDGKSATRRSCNITLVTEKVNISDYRWSLKTKIKILTGLKNSINSIYPEIIWFPQGIFVISSFSSSLSTTGYTISISGKDKMSLLNGDLGGTLAMPINFSKYDLLDENGKKTGESPDLPIKDIILGIVHTYGNDRIENIIINDLDISGYQYIMNRLDKPLYGLINAGVPNFRLPFDLMNINQKIGLFTAEEKEDIDTTKACDKSYEFFNTDYKDRIITYDGEEYYLRKFESGEIIGNKETELTYASKDGLIGNVGETFTSVLDKIVNMLGDFEYFYDLDGRFIFQAKKIYVNTSWNNIKLEENEIYVEDAMNLSPIFYSFTNNDLIISLNNNPDLGNLKNDFSVWGENNNNNPIHIRYAIQNKPIYYKTYVDANEEKSGEEYYTESYDSNGCVDWRELIYQMAVDYRKFHLKDDFLKQIQDNNIINGESLYPNGKTYYEQYYLDIEGFWRDLYDPSLGKGEPERNWKTEVIYTPENIKFWFDLLETSGELSQYANNIIGQRQKFINDKDAKVINRYNTPLFIFFKEESQEELEKTNINGYIPVKLSDDVYETCVEKGAAASPSKTIKSVIDNLLSNYTYCTESISMTTIPIYYLQPNKLVDIYDEVTGVNGRYIINQITIPLQYNGAMSINCIKQPKPIY